MRILILTALLAIPALAAPPPDAAADEAKLARLLAGRVAGAPQACLPDQRNARSTQVGETAIVYRVGNTQWVNRPAGGCNGMGRGYSLISQTPIGRSCRGDIVNVRDLRTGFDYGGCVLGDFVPYRRGR